MVRLHAEQGDAGAVRPRGAVRLRSPSRIQRRGRVSVFPPRAAVRNVAARIRLPDDAAARGGRLRANRLSRWNNRSDRATIARPDGTLRTFLPPFMRRLALRNTDRLSAYSRTDVRVTFSTLGHWEFYGEVINVFNHRNYLIEVEVPSHGQHAGERVAEQRLHGVRAHTHGRTCDSGSEDTTQWETDLDLVRRMLHGDEAAFERFFEATYPALYRFALARLDFNRDAAAEVAQAAICKAIRKLHTYRGEAALLTWLSTFCRHELYAYRKRHNAPQVDAAGRRPGSACGARVAAGLMRTISTRRWTGRGWRRSSSACSITCRRTTPTRSNGSTSTDSASRRWPAARRRREGGRVAVDAGAARIS